jgi:hypothetical protein
MSGPPWKISSAEQVPADIVQAISHQQWWGRWFKGEGWDSWRAFLSATFALKMTPEQLAIYQECTGRHAAPSSPAKEAWLIIGRRGGKSRILALIAAWLSCFVDWRHLLSPGEMGVVQVIAADKSQAKTVLRYLRSFIVQHPLLKQLVKRQTSETIELSCRITIQVSTASFRTVRGFTLVAALCDELGFWWTDEGAANVDTEVIAALKPSMATIPNAMLLCASSPYAKKGALWTAFRKHFGQDGPALIWKAATRVMNPTVAQSVVDEAMEADPAHATAEFMAEFRSDLQDYITREIIDSVVVPGRHELPPMSGVSYVGFVDPSGGSSDSMTLAIAHRDKEGCAILDLIREKRPPFSPQVTVAEFATALKMYRINTVSGDRYAGAFSQEPFRERGIKYEVSEKPKSDLYRDLLPLLNSGKVELLDHQRLAAQLCGLERRTARSGKDSIDHAPGAHDDLANSVAGALTMAAGGRPPMKISAGAMARARERPTGGSRWPSRLQTPRCFFGSSDQR